MSLSWCLPVQPAERWQALLPFNSGMPDGVISFDCLLHALNIRAGCQHAVLDRVFAESGLLTRCPDLVCMQEAVQADDFIS